MTNHMDNILLVIITSGFGGIVITKLFDYLTVRLSARSRQDKAADLVQTYLQINGITADQLEESLNQVWRLSNQNVGMLRELSEMRAKRAERDDQMEAMSAHLAALQEQINKDSAERADLQAKLSKFEAKYRAMWQYLLALLEQMKRHDIIPVEPPKELTTDPEIMRVVTEIKRKVKP